MFQKYLYITDGDETKMQMMSEWLDVCNKIGRLKDGGQQYRWYNWAIKYAPNVV